MTATLSASAPVERSLRLLPIAANLLPPEVSGSRRTRKVRLVTVSAVATVIAVVAAWYGLATYQTASAESDVTAAQDRAAGLRIQQKSFSGLAGVQKESAAIEGELATVMKDDQKWADVVSSVTAALPPGKAQLTVVNAALNDSTSAGPAPALPPNTSGQVLMGTLKITGYADDKPAVAQYVKNLASARGVANAVLTSAVLDEQKGGYTFTVDADATTKVASTRFTAPKHASKGAK